MDALIVTCAALSLVIILLLMFTHSLIKELDFITDQHRQATGQIKRLNKSIRNHDIELIKAYAETATWKQMYLDMIKTDTDFSQL